MKRKKEEVKMVSNEEVEKEAKYKGRTLSCHAKREYVVVLKNGRMVAVNAAMYKSLKIPVRKI